MGFPVEMTEFKAWAVSTGAPLPDGRLDKIPRNPATGAPIDPTDPSQWSTFADCAAAVNSGAYKFLGFLLSDNDPYVIIDLDPDKPDEFMISEAISRAFSGTYQEISASGRGIHIIVRGSIPVDGCRHNFVELYSNKRYMICTGNVFYDKPITEQKILLTQLFTETAQVSGAVADGSFDIDSTDIDCRRSDAEIFDIACNASNGEKFKMLCEGRWEELGYRSASDGDMALFNILAFYSEDNSQCVRIFKMTPAGKRDKCFRKDYLQKNMSKARAAASYSVISTMENPLEQDAGARGHVEITAESMPLENRPEAPGFDEWGYDRSYTPLPWPPGWTGQLAQYIFKTSLRPVPEASIIAALGLIAGLVGRSYNTATGTGLNLYQILVAPTGTGKEGMKSGIDRVLASMITSIPVVYDRIGPAVIASGQALIKLLDEKPCCISVFGEFGQTVSRLSDKRVNSADSMLLQMLLDLYTKSGRGARLDGMIYSDKTKNVPVLQSPCFSFIGETTPQIYSDLDLTMVESGLLPRINLVEYTGDRPKPNKNADIPIDEVLLRQLCGMTLSGFALEQRKAVLGVEHSPEAEKMLDALNDEADHKINSHRSEAVRQIWNRFHLKVLKIASILAVFDDFNRPIVTPEHVTWADTYCRRDIETWMQKFEQGEIGSSDLRGAGLLGAVLEGYKKVPVESRIQAYGASVSVAARNDLIPMRFIRKRLKSTSFFQKHPKGTNFAIDMAIKEALSSELMVELPLADKITLGIHQTAKFFKVL